MTLQHDFMTLQHDFMTLHHVYAHKFIIYDLTT